MTKTASTNFTAAGTNFPIATENTDDLDADDLFSLQLALEQHTHDSTRGLAIRRLNTSSTPSATGHVQVNGDDLRWWAAVAAAVRTAATLEGSQVWTGQQRFNQPLVLPNQGSVPAAPGAGLSLVYTKTDGMAYIRSGTGTERPVGALPGVAFPAIALRTLGTPGTWAEQRQVTLAGGTFLEWVCTFDPAAAEMVDFSFPVPPSYAGTPISFLIEWYTTAVTGNAMFQVSATVTGTGDSLATAVADKTGANTFAAQGTADRKQLSTLPWTAALPAANDWVQARFTRMGDQGLDTLATDANVLGITVAF